MDAPQWHDLKLCKQLLRAIADLGFQAPMPIQVQASNPILSGADVLATACTGSGKTLAFLLPIIQRLLLSRQSGTARCVIVSPTRELAAQTFRVFEQISQYTQLSGILVVGGNSSRNVEAEGVALARASPDVVVATPGRLVDHLQSSRNFSMEDTEILVLDEADKLLGMGFEDQVNEILARSPGRQQTLLFSATLGSDVQAISRASLRSPVTVAADAAGSVAAGLRQEFIRLHGATDDSERLAVLFALLTRGGVGENTIVFFATKALLARAAAACKIFEINAAQLHGDLTQAQRAAMLAHFARGGAPICLCTNVAARGLDLPDVRHVVSVGLPRDLDDYIHRIGRTARAGRQGCAITIVDERERKDLKHVVIRSGGKAFARTVDSAARAVWRERLLAADEPIRAIIAENRIAAQIAEAERDIRKAENMVAHAEDIMSRPRRVWNLEAGEAAAQKKGSAEAREAARRRRAELARAQPNAIEKRAQEMLAHARVVKRLERDYSQGLISRSEMNRGRELGGLQNRDAVRAERKQQKKLAQTIRAQKRKLDETPKTEGELLRDMAQKIKAAKTVRAKRAGKAFHSKKKFKRR